MCLERATTRVLSDFRIYHNYVQSTPAEECGITVDCENKRKRLIQNV